MAGLSDIDIDAGIETVMLPKGGSFTVRGLALSDITRIFRARTQDLSDFFEHYMAENDKLSSGDPKYQALKSSTKFGGALLEKAPDVVADIIAYASDEPTKSHVARTLPFPVQLDALEKIAALTFTEEDGAKKAAETVMRMITGGRNLMGDLTQQVSGFIPSDDKSASS